ncbi:TPA: hypothetical protein N6134_005060, partial [Escherichia coli]|nr:hypothetical protein [Escherichia coli]
ATNTFGESVTKYSLWLAQYDGSEPTDEVIWDTWAGWQYTDTGSIEGVNGDVDLNRFNDGIFIENTAPEEEPAEQPEEQPSEPAAPPEAEGTPATYLIKWGDTLWSLSK